MAASQDISLLPFDMAGIDAALISLPFLDRYSQASLASCSWAFHSACLQPQACEARCLTWCGGNVAWAKQLKEGLRLDWPSFLAALHSGADIAGDHRLLDDCSQLLLVRAYAGGLHGLMALPPGAELDVQACSTSVPSGAEPRIPGFIVSRKTQRSAEATYAWCWSMFPQFANRNESTQTPALRSTAREVEFWKLIKPSPDIEKGPLFDDTPQPVRVSIVRRCRVSRRPAQSSSPSGIVSDVWRLRGLTPADHSQIPRVMRCIHARVDTAALLHPRLAAESHPLLRTCAHLLSAPGYTCCDYGSHGVEIQRCTLDMADSSARREQLLAQRQDIRDLQSSEANATVWSCDADAGAQPVRPVSTAADQIAQDSLTCADVSLHAVDTTQAVQYYTATEPASPAAAAGEEAAALSETDRPLYYLLLHKVTGDPNVVSGALTACVPLHFNGLLAAAAQLAASDTDQPSQASVGPHTIEPPYRLRDISFGTLPPLAFHPRLNPRPDADTADELGAALLLPVAQDAMMLKNRALVGRVRSELHLGWSPIRASSLFSRCLLPMHSWHAAHGVVNYEHGTWNPRPEPSFLGIALQHRFWRSPLRQFWAVEAEAVRARSRQWSTQDARQFAESGAALHLAAPTSSPEFGPGFDSQSSRDSLLQEVEDSRPRLEPVGWHRHNVQNQSVLALAWMGDSMSQEISHTLIYFPLEILSGPALVSDGIPPEVEPVLQLLQQLSPDGQSPEGSASAVAAPVDSLSSSQLQPNSPPSPSTIASGLADAAYCGLLHSAGVPGLQGGMRLVLKAL